MAWDRGRALLVHFLLGYRTYLCFGKCFIGGPISLEQFVERGLFGIHLGPFNGVDHNLRRIDRSLGALGSCRQPIIMRSRHQHELAPAVARNLDGLSLSLVLKLAEFALEFQGACLDHDRVITRIVE